MGKYIENILQRIENWISRHNLLTEGVTVIAAVSGGSDSIFMLWSLRQLTNAHRCPLRAVHINHQLRGKESDNDEIFVRKLCRSWKIPLQTYRVDVKQKLEEMGIGIEEASRIVRMEIFDDEAHLHNGVVAVAHTADDVVETMLFNLIRGSGIRGLAGIQPKRANIIRPILSVWRREERVILRRENISWREDSTNADKHFSRNRIRHELLPYLKRHFGVDTIKHIHDAASMLYRTRRALEESFRLRFQEALIGESEGLLMFRSKIALSDTFTFGELLRQTLPRLGIGLKDFSIEKTEKIFEILTSMTDERKCSIFGGAFAVRTAECLLIGDRIPIQMSEEELFPDETMSLKADMGDIRIDFSPPPRNPLSKEKLTVYVAYKNEPITIAPYLSEFYFQPLGGVTVKLSSFLKNRKVPKIFRRALPLIFIGQKLAWIGGVEISEQCKITPQTKQALKICWSGNFPEMVSATMKSIE